MHSVYFFDEHIATVHFAAKQRGVLDRDEKREIETRAAKSYELRTGMNITNFIGIMYVKLNLS